MISAITRGISARYGSALRLALDLHQRPTAMLLRDPYAGHRNTYTDEPDGPLEEWTSWDFALAMATQAVKDGTTEDGHLRWEVEADDVDVIVEHEIDKSREAKEIVSNGKDYKPVPGEYLRTRLFHPYYDKESGEEETWQTRSEWFDSLVKEEEARNE